VRIGTLDARRADMTPDAEVLESSKQTWRRPSPAFRKELSHVADGTRPHGAARRASTVDYYGTQDAAQPGRHALRAEATCSSCSPRQERARRIAEGDQELDLGSIRLNDGQKLIRVPIPALTEERRRDW